MKFHKLVAGTREGEWYAPLHLEFPIYGSPEVSRSFARVEYRRLRRYERMTRTDARLLVLGRLVALFDAIPVTAVFA